MEKQNKLAPGFLERCIDQAMGRMPADLVIKNVKFLNLVTGDIAESDIAISGDRIIGTYEGYEGAREIDGRGLIAVPGFIDTHVHCEIHLGGAVRVRPYRAAARHHHGDLRSA